MFTSCAIATMSQLISKLYCHLKECPLIYLVYCSFIIIDRLCSTHPDLSNYLLYGYIFIQSICAYKAIASNFLRNRERNKKYQIELEDIQLQAEIVNTKLSVFEAELNERLMRLKKEVAQLREVRARIVELIATDETCKHLLHAVNQFDPDTVPPNIVKVTNVYKVAYLKQYIKQKRFRRYSKRAYLRKKMESIKELFEDWQRKLSMVINCKMASLHVDPHCIDMASQEAMGDYSKPSDISDSDSDLRNSDIMFYDEFRSNKNEGESGMSREYCDFGDYSSFPQCEYFSPHTVLPIAEETGSQLAVEETTSENTDEDYLDNVAI